MRSRVPIGLLCGLVVSHASTGGNNAAGPTVVYELELDPEDTEEQTVVSQRFPFLNSADSLGLDGPSRRFHCRNHALSNGVRFHLFDEPSGEYVTKLVIYGRSMAQLAIYEFALSGLASTFAMDSVKACGVLETLLPDLQLLDGAPVGSSTGAGASDTWNEVATCAAEGVTFYLRGDPDHYFGTLPMEWSCTSLLRPLSRIDRAIGRSFQSLTDAAVHIAHPDVGLPGVQLTSFTQGFGGEFLDQMLKNRLFITSKVSDMVLEELRAAAESLLQQYYRIRALHASTSVANAIAENQSTETHSGVMEGALEMNSSAPREESTEAQNSVDINNAPPVPPQAIPPHSDVSVESFAIRHFGTHREMIAAMSEIAERHNARKPKQHMKKFLLQSDVMAFFSDMLFEAAFNLEPPEGRVIHVGVAIDHRQYGESSSHDEVSTTSDGVSPGGCRSMIISLGVSDARKLLGLPSAVFEDHDAPVAPEISSRTRSMCTNLHLVDEASGISVESQQTVERRFGSVNEFTDRMGEVSQIVFDGSLSKKFDLVRLYNAFRIDRCLASLPVLTKLWARLVHQISTENDSFVRKLLSMRTAGVLSVARMAYGAVAAFGYNMKPFFGQGFASDHLRFRMRVDQAQPLTSMLTGGGSPPLSMLEMVFSSTVEESPNLARALLMVTDPGKLAIPGVKEMVKRLVPLDRNEIGSELAFRMNSLTELLTKTADSSDYLHKVTAVGSGFNIFNSSPYMVNIVPGSSRGLQSARHLSEMFTKETAAKAVPAVFSARKRTSPSIILSGVPVVIGGTRHSIGALAKFVGEGLRACKNGKEYHEVLPLCRILYVDEAGMLRFHVDELERIKTRTLEGQDSDAEQGTQLENPLYTGPVHYSQLLRGVRSLGMLFTAFLVHGESLGVGFGEEIVSWLNQNPLVVKRDTTDVIKLIGSSSAFLVLIEDQLRAAAASQTLDPNVGGGNGQTQESVTQEVVRTFLESLVEFLAYPLGPTGRVSLDDCRIINGILRGRKIVSIQDVLRVDGESANDEVSWRLLDEAMHLVAANATPSSVDSGPSPLDEYDSSEDMGPYAKFGEIVIGNDRVPELHPSFGVTHPGLVWKHRNYVLRNAETELLTDQNGFALSHARRSLKIGRDPTNMTVFIHTFADARMIQQDIEAYLSNTSKDL